jgi:ankyrin repeat protein
LTASSAPLHLAIQSHAASAHYSHSQSEQLELALATTADASSSSSLPSSPSRVLDVAVDDSINSLDIPLDAHGNTLLHIAARGGKLNPRKNTVSETLTVSELIADGASLDVRNNSGNTPLIEASIGLTERQLHTLEVITDYKELITALVSAGADINIANNKGHRALYYIRVSSLADVGVEEMLTTTAEDSVEALNALGNTALLDACAGMGQSLVGIYMKSEYEGYMNTIEALLDAGSDVNAKNSLNGNTALHFACEAREMELIEFLLERGAVGGKVKNAKGQTALSYLPKGSSKKWKDIKALLK